MIIMINKIIITNVINVGMDNYIDHAFIYARLSRLFH